MKEDKISSLRQLIDSMKEAEEKLEEAYESKNYENFTRIKKFLLIGQRKIIEELK